ncbi:phage head closure protein [Bacillus badius]|uniref:phage head closure protein n=1 Tax=Bacillus badius TaxID=1455 RepID=UPI002E1D2D6A|nr:phage head closure protein [Bacillus badius]MED0665667.1 phage head closure protein [Bacillus badius]
MATQRNSSKKTSYKKDKKITILKITSEQDDLGFPIEKTEPLPGGENIWAYYRHATGNEFYGAATTNFKVEVVFKIAWRDDIRPLGFKILFRGKEYGITRIDDYEGYKQDLTIYAYAIN